MDSKTIKAAVLDLEKASDGETILTILNRLKEGVQATEQLLRETKVGVAVNKHRSSSNPEIVSAVKTMIKKWKDEVKKEKLKKPEKPKAEPEKPSKPTKTYSGVRNVRTDGVDTALYDLKPRNGSITALYNALAKDSKSHSPEEILGIAVKIEKEVFAMFKEDVGDPYRAKVRMLFLNVGSANNPELRAKLLNKHIEPEKLVKMLPEDMVNESMKKEMEQILQENLFKAKSAEEKRAITDSFICGKCKQRKVTYYQMQTRSADEPLTTFCTCVNCGNHWTFS